MKQDWGIQTSHEVSGYLQGKHQVVKERVLLCSLSADYIYLEWGPRSLTSKKKFVTTPVPNGHG